MLEAMALARSPPLCHMVEVAVPKPNDGKPGHWKLPFRFGMRKHRTAWCPADEEGPTEAQRKEERVDLALIILS